MSHINKSLTTVSPQSAHFDAPIPNHRRTRSDRRGGRRDSGFIIAPSPREIRLSLPVRSIAATKQSLTLDAAALAGRSTKSRPSVFPRSMSSVVTVALPVFAVIAVGILAGRLKLATADDSAALNRFVFRFGFPAALFALMSGAAGLSSLDLRLTLSYGAAALIVIVFAYFFARRIFGLDEQDSGAHAFASVIGNAVFLGLPIAINVEGWGTPFVKLMLVEGILIIGVGAALMAPRDDANRIGPAKRLMNFITRPLKNPLVAAALAGFGFASLGLELPAPARSFFEMLGRAAGPIALFSLGLFFSTRNMPPLSTTLGKSIAIASFKLGLLPALAFTFASIFGVNDFHYRGALALFTLTPTAVGAFVMASQYRRYVDETAAAIAFTTTLSILSISAALVLFAR